MKTPKCIQRNVLNDKLDKQFEFPTEYQSRTIFPKPLNRTKALSTAATTSVSPNDHDLLLN